MRLKEYEKSYRLSFENGVSVEILRQGGTFKGLGQVKLRRRKLRSAELPIMPLIRTPDGYEVSRLHMEDMRKGKQSLTLTLTPYLKRCGRMEWVCTDGQDRWNVGPWEQDEERDRGGMVQLRLQAVERTLGETQFVGFSYSYKFRSRKYRIYRVHDRATWELGGRATGNSFWMAGPFNPLQKSFQNKSDGFTTSWCHFGKSDVQLQQFLPFFSVLQGFTFQFNANNLLVTAFESPFPCRSLFQKSSGESYLIHWHQLCGELGGCLDFPALQILCADNEGNTDTDLANLYCAVREELQREYCEAVGLVREAAAISGALAIGADPHAEALERGLDELAESGCERVYVPDLMRRLAPRGVVNKRSKSARNGVQSAARFVKYAHHRGLEVGLALSDCCRPWVVAGNLTEAAQEQWQSLRSGTGDRLVGHALRRGAARQFLLDHLRRLRREVAVDVLFADDILDSIADQFDWSQSADQHGDGRDEPRFDQKAGAIRPLAPARRDLVADLQRMGYRCPVAGVTGLATSGARVAYEDLDGKEFMLRDMVVHFPYEAIVQSGDDPLEAYFRACANRVSYVTTYDLTRGVYGKLENWWRQEYAAVNQAYHAVRDYMERSHLLPDDRGVLWTGAEPDIRVLWAYKEFEWPVGQEAEVFDVMAADPVELVEGVFSPGPYRTYLIQGADGP